MSFWQLVTLLAALFNTAALVYWQRANETRLDIQAQRQRDLQTKLEAALPLLRQVSGQLDEWERSRQGTSTTDERSGAS